MSKKYLTSVYVSDNKILFDKLKQYYGVEPKTKYLIGLEISYITEKYYIDIEFVNIPKVIEECILLNNAFKDNTDICNVGISLVDITVNGLVIDCLFMTKNLTPVNEKHLELFVLEDMERGVYTTFVPFSNINSIIF